MPRLTRKFEKKRIPAAKLPDNVFTIEQAAELFDLPLFDAVSESMWEGIEVKAISAVCWKKDWDFDFDSWIVTTECDACNGYGYLGLGDEEPCEVCRCSGTKEIDIDDARESDEYEKAYCQAEGEVHSAWQNSVEHVLEQHAEYINMRVVEVCIVRTEPDGKVWEEDGYQLVPKKSWYDTGSKLLEIINGMGYFEFPSMRALMDSLPTNSPKRAVLDHLGWLPDYNYVFESSPNAARRVYDDYMDHYLRSW